MELADFFFVFLKFKDVINAIHVFILATNLLFFSVAGYRLEYGLPSCDSNTITISSSSKSCALMDFKPARYCRCLEYGLDGGEFESCFWNTSSASAVAVDSASMSFIIIFDLQRLLKIWIAFDAINSFSPFAYTFHTHPNIFNHFSRRPKLYNWFISSRRTILKHQRNTYLNID